MVISREKILQQQRQQLEAWARSQHTVFTLTVTALTIAITIGGYAIGIKSVISFLLLGTILSAWTGGFEPGMFTAIVSVFAIYLAGIIPDIAAVHIPLFLVLAMIVSALEQTRIETGQALKDARDQMEIIFNGVGDAITAQAPDGRMIFANEAAARVSAVQSAAEMLRIPEGKYLDWFKFFREDGTPLAYEELPHRLLMKDGRSHELVYRLIHLPTGAERWMYLRSSPILDGRGHVAMIINIFRDVSDVKRQAVELARLNGLLTDQSARLNNLIKNIPGAVWEADVQNNQAPSIRVMNDYFGRLLGYESKEGTADPYYPGPEDVHPDDRPAIARGVIDLLAGKPTVLSYRIRHHEGHYVDVETYCSVASDDNGVKHLYGVTMDITKRKQAEQAALQQAEMLRQSNDDLQQFAYVASHDLQEPLRMVTSYLQLVEQRYASKLDDDAREFIGYAVDGSNRMKALIQDLLMYSRVETSNRDFAEMRVQDALDAAVHNLQLTFEDTKAALNVSALPTVRADQSQIAQLFQNLIANAIKFRSERPPVIEIGCVREDAFWHFKVADNGIGIEPQHLERIFVIFQRLHTRSKYPGTGIGLAICKRVIERHGGKIWAESQPGVGTAIHFTLPSNPERSTP